MCLDACVWEVCKYIIMYIMHTYMYTYTHDKVNNIGLGVG